MPLSPAIRAILFDLDDTLIRIEFEAFMNDYLSLLAPRFAHACAPQRFVKELMASVAAMVDNTDASRRTWRFSARTFSRNSA
ncbi:MAG: hypothetical protein HPY55_07450 [Firmicutes bacterium]|nr:hypothetical protein [Bacillota bacterium]